MSHHVLLFELDVTCTCFRHMEWNRHCPVTLLCGVGLFIHHPYNGKEQTVNNDVNLN